MAFFIATTFMRPSTLLDADFGEGTINISIVRFEFARGALMARLTGQGSSVIAGDQFDTRIIDHVLLPFLGKGSSYQSMEQTS